MKYDTLKQAHTLVEGYSQAERDLLKPFLPVLPKQKTIEEIIGDVYEAYMWEEDKTNSDRLDEIHFQLESWVKNPPARETAYSLADYEELSESSVVLGRGLPWVKKGNLWHNTFGEPLSDEDMVGEPREVIRKGDGNV